MLTVLVLGVGGNVSQGILKALALSSLPKRVVGACVDARSAGLYLVDRAYLSPPAADPRFLPWLMQTCREEQVAAVLSGVEPVLAQLAHVAGRLYEETGAVAIVSKPAVLAIGDDKLRTCEWLRDRGFHYPLFADSGDPAGLAALKAKVHFPLLAKPRQGKGSAGIFRIENDADLARGAALPGYVVQEWLGSEDTEYTAGCFCDRDGSVRGCITMRRTLLHGTTYRAEVCLCPEIREQAVAITRALAPTGPCNVQLRWHQGRPVCFELNIRFSGTTSMRARFGFNDVELALRHFVLGEPAADLPVVERGVALRYWNELYVDPAAVSLLQAEGSLSGPEATIVEDFGKQ